MPEPEDNRTFLIQPSEGATLEGKHNSASEPSDSNPMSNDPKFMPKKSLLRAHLTKRVIVLAVVAVLVIAAGVTSAIYYSKHTSTKSVAQTQASKSGTVSKSAPSVPITACNPTAASNDTQQTINGLSVDEVTMAVPKGGVTPLQVGNGNYLIQCLPDSTSSSALSGWDYDGKAIANYTNCVLSNNGLTYACSLITGDNTEISVNGKPFSRLSIKANVDAVSNDGSSVAYDDYVNTSATNGAAANYSYYVNGKTILTVTGQSETNNENPSFSNDLSDSLIQTQNGNTSSPLDTVYLNGKAIVTGPFLTGGLSDNGQHYWYVNYESNSTIFNVDGNNVADTANRTVPSGSLVYVYNGLVNDDGSYAYFDAPDSILHTSAGLHNIPTTFTPNTCATAIQACGIMVLATQTGSSNYFISTNYNSQNYLDGQPISLSGVYDAQFIGSTLYIYIYPGYSATE